MNKTIDLIPMATSRNLAGLFKERVKRSASDTAYKYFSEANQTWQTLSWQDMAREVAHWQGALRKDGLQAGDRVGIILRNCPEWVKFEQAALGLQLVVVPLYTNDRADNIAYIIEDANVQCILFEGEEHWQVLNSIIDRLGNIKRFISLHKLANANDERVRHVNEWVDKDTTELAPTDFDGDSLASIVYTSGTTGNPKGVMLSHKNILWNAWSSVQCEPFYTDDVFLSFLPLSHMFERTAGYYIPMTSGGCIAYARSIEKLAEDLLIIKPTVLVSVPRIFERVYNKIKTQLAQKSPVARGLFHAAVKTGWQRFEIQQDRSGWSPRQLLWPLLNLLIGKKIMGKLGGQIRMALCGGAPLPVEVGKTFIGLGLPLLQGYGMTELSPVVSVNRFAKNDPASVGITLPDVEVKLGKQDELLVRCPGVMQGYWNNEQATQETIDKDGWLHTGDVARIEDDFIYITGRIKDIIVLANGEKLPPADLEMAIANDTLFDQAMVIGEGKPFMSAIVVLNPDSWPELASQLGIEPDASNLDHDKVIESLLERLNQQLKRFPGYANIYKVKATLDPWTVDNGMITPTLKLKRHEIQEEFQQDIQAFYEGH